MVWQVEHSTPYRRENDGTAWADGMNNNNNSAAAARHTSVRATDAADIVSFIFIFFP